MDRFDIAVICAENDENDVRPRLSSPECLFVLDIRLTTSPEPRSQERSAPPGGSRLEQLLLHPSCMLPRRGGGLRVRGTASAWNGWWPDCGVWVTCQRSFRA